MITLYLCRDHGICCVMETRFNSSKMKVQCFLQKCTLCCIARDLRMLHIKIFIINAVEEILLTKNGEFSDHVQPKLLWIPEAPGCSLVVEHIALGRSFSWYTKTLCCKNLDHLSRFDQSQNIPKSGYWLLIGCVKQLEASRNQRSRSLLHN